MMDIVLTFSPRPHPLSTSTAPISITCVFANPTALSVDSTPKATTRRWEYLEVQWARSGCPNAQHLCTSPEILPYLPWIFQCSIPSSRLPEETSGIVLLALIVSIDPTASGSQPGAGGVTLCPVASRMLQHASFPHAYGVW